MLKHIPSGDDIDIVIDDDGNLYIICDKQGKVWTGKLTPNNIPKTTRQAAGVSPVIRQLALRDRLFLKSYGTSDAVIRKILEGDIIKGK